ncbi:MAG: acylneuraminate cytidylyltransferase family protein, partial [Rikenellaceae bacterium]|nr:acylneuraminate cytidylyltransferase family protein [Rikenellaceae bacterium]
MRRVAFVPIRLNSQRVEGKNLRELGGRPLMAYLLESLAAARNIDKVYVYCSNPAIVEYLPEGVEWLQRDERLDQNTTLGEEIYDAFTREVEADIYILAHATSPFIRTATIEQAVRSVESGEYDSAFSAERVQTFAWWQGRPLNYSLQHVPRTQDLEPLYVETSAFFVFRAEVWREQHRRIGQKPYMAVTDRIESMDIDDPDDF